MQTFPVQVKLSYLNMPESRFIAVIVGTEIFVYIIVRAYPVPMQKIGRETTNAVSRHTYEIFA